MAVAINIIGSSNNNVDLVTVIDSIRDLKVEMELSEAASDEDARLPRDFEIHQVERGRDINKDVEEIEIVCCSNIEILSTGLLSRLYPGVVGEYSKIDDGSARQMYRKSDLSNLFIYKPQTKMKVGFNNT